MLLWTDTVSFGFAYCGTGAGKKITLQYADLNYTTIHLIKYKEDLKTEPQHVQSASAQRLRIISAYLKSQEIFSFMKS